MKRRLPFEILHEDRDVIAIDKPAGLLTTNTRLAGRLARESQPTAENFLNDYVRKGQAKSSRRVWLVHRLDRDTSGAMLFAKDERFAEAMRADWNRLTGKTYLALVEGELEEQSGFFESYLRDDPRTMKVSSVKDARQGKLARTEWRRLSVGGGATLVEVKLKTGRKNQIRVHFSEAGHPVVGDVKYGGAKSTRLHLHSLSIEYENPRTREKRRIEAPLFPPGSALEADRRWK
ncbi:MAG: RluA family pseudouridine synthase [Kiritimatiellae bacterium]|nr:RluA family pseudouridine synthase [Kiritimatiellia bacterium]